MGAADPESLAHQLALLIDGAIVAAMVSRDPAVADTAGLAAGKLFGPSKVKKPKRAAGSGTAGGGLNKVCGGASNDHRAGPIAFNSALAACHSTKFGAFRGFEVESVAAPPLFRPGAEPIRP